MNGVFVKKKQQKLMNEVLSIFLFLFYDVFRADIDTLTLPLLVCLVPL